MDAQKSGFKNLVQDQVKEVYEKPLFVEENGMEFSKEVWEDFHNEQWCFGCTNCNCN
ncbi:MAG: hypothetical protein GQ564_06000 [Bacteroidales bacterium]|nr:hypothetical protein [Bacteroidales bacterium]